MRSHTRASAAVETVLGAMVLWAMTVAMMDIYHWMHMKTSAPRLARLVADVMAQAPSPSKEVSTAAGSELRDLIDAWAQSAIPTVEGRAVSAYLMARGRCGDGEDEVASHVFDCTGAGDKTRCESTEGNRWGWVTGGVKPDACGEGHAKTLARETLCRWTGAVPECSVDQMSEEPVGLLVVQACLRSPDLYIEYFTDAPWTRGVHVLPIPGGEIKCRES